MQTIDPPRLLSCGNGRMALILGGITVEISPHDLKMTARAVAEALNWRPDHQSATFRADETPAVTVTRPGPELKLTLANRVLVADPLGIAFLRVAHECLDGMEHGQLAFRRQWLARALCDLLHRCSPAIAKAVAPLDARQLAGAVRVAAQPRISDRILSAISPSVAKEVVVRLKENTEIGAEDHLGASALAAGLVKAMLDGSGLFPAEQSHHV